MTQTLSTSAYWVSRPGSGELREHHVSAKPQPGHSLIRAEWSAVSPGTERLVALGRVPSDCARVMACRYMSGGFELPVKYGYSLVGTAIAGHLTGERVFVMHPHQSLAEVDDRDATVLDSRIPAARATLIPGLETALNAVWDADLVPRERCAVVGAGLIGLLVGYVIHRQHGMPVEVVEADPMRLRLAESLPWIDRAVSDGASLSWAVDVTFHASGSPSGLQTAIDVLGFEGRAIELSWYGDARIELELGTHFHYQRKRIIASQVATVAATKRGTVSCRDRLNQVVSLLDDRLLDLLLSSPVAFESMPELMRDVYRGNTPDVLPLIQYS